LQPFRIVDLLKCFVPDVRKRLMRRPPISSGVSGALDVLDVLALDKSSSTVLQSPVHSPSLAQRTIAKVRSPIAEVRKLERDGPDFFVAVCFES
jgi:hypothetical protein